MYLVWRTVSIHLAGVSWPRGGAHVAEGYRGAAGGCRARATSGGAVVAAVATAAAAAAATATGQHAQRHSCAAPAAEGGTEGALS